MIDHSLLADLLSTFAIGLVFVVALARLRVPSLVALMLAGVAAGPSVLGVVDSPARVDALAVRVREGTGGGRARPPRRASENRRYVR